MTRAAAGGRAERVFVVVQAMEQGGAVLPHQQVIGLARDVGLETADVFGDQGIQVHGCTFRPEWS